MGRRLRNQTIKEGVDTQGAKAFARNTYNSPKDVKLNWWGLFSNYRMKKWKQELKDLNDSTGISFEYVCKYMGQDNTGLPGFYRKVPKTKETYIGIGMAYKVPLKTINRWLMKYGGKKKLYIKDALNDLIWIYLINSNYTDESREINYYSKFNECRQLIEDVMIKMSADDTAEEADTVEMNNSAENILFDENYINLKKFIKENIGAFKSAYVKPKNFLNTYIDNILNVKNENKPKGRNWTLNTLRGYLDDSMINYITSGIKYVPKNKRTHISIALALGMTIDDIDRYLEMLGYDYLDGTYLEEGLLINLLESWEEEHKMQRKFKEKYIYRKSGTDMEPEEKLHAVDDMLKLRSEIKEQYENFSENVYNKGGIKKFPYMND